MKLPRRRVLHLAASAAALPAMSRVAMAQAYPSRPVHWIVGFTPAGGNDIAFSTFQSARSILEPSRTVLDATATKWSLDVAQTTSRLDYQKMETMAESARRVGSLSPSLTRRIMCEATFLRM